LHSHCIFCLKILTLFFLLLKQQFTMELSEIIHIKTEHRVFLPSPQRASAGWS
jgi:hypothetical protein